MEVVKADGMVNIMTVERTLDRCGVTHRNRYWTLSSPATVYNLYMEMYSAAYIIHLYNTVT